MNNYADLRNSKARTLANTGKDTEALTFIDKSLEMDPR